MQLVKRQDSALVPSFAYLPHTHLSCAASHRVGEYGLSPVVQVSMGAVESHHLLSQSQAGEARRW